MTAQYDCLTILKKLLSKPSISPNDAGCQEYIAELLQQLGLTVEHLPQQDVSNLWAHGNTNNPKLCFVGHTDVVPTGKLDAWQRPPFAAEIAERVIYGRGAQDMKGAIAAFISALAEFLTTKPQAKQKIALLLTSDEEGTAEHGIKAVMPLLHSKNIHIDCALIGEPTSKQTSGDQIKIGRRGSLNAYVKILGRQGHVAYPDQAENPIHRCLETLQYLTQQSWCQGNQYFQATQLQIVNISAGEGVSNVIPGELNMHFNLRYSPERKAADLQSEIEQIFSDQQLEYAIEWQHTGEPFYTAKADYLKQVVQAISKVCGQAPTLSTSGGTSDGRFIAPYGTQVIECGLPNTYIHQINECLKLSDLNLLKDIYLEILHNVIKV